MQSEEESKKYVYLPSRHPLSSSFPFGCAIVFNRYNNDILLLFFWELLILMHQHSAGALYDCPYARENSQSTYFCFQPPFLSLVSVCVTLPCLLFHFLCVNVFDSVTEMGDDRDNFTGGSR